MRRNTLLLAISLFSATAIADITVKDAWVRGTVAAQTTTGAFMTITSSEEAKLVGARSAIAKTTEIHQSMLMDGVNHMHAADAVPLPAGKSIELKPGGYHVMLMGLARPVAAGQKVPIELIVEDKHGKRSKVEVQAEVRPLGQ